ncbi:EAL domain-containing protein [bacterium]|nr:EAL domain-containing protein [bacterium]MBU1993955.1 EAL domain-containing protein [bacterium]
MNKDSLYRSELVKIAYDYLALSSSVVVVNATVLSLVLYDEVNTTQLLVWYLLMISVSLLRFISSKVYTANENFLSPKRWEQLFLLGVIISGTLWGTASFMLFVEGNIAYQSMLIIVIAGLSAGGISSLSSILRAIQLFLFTTLLPLIFTLLMQDTQLHNYIAFLSSLFLITLLFIAKRFNENYLNIITSRQMYENEKEKLLLTQERFETIFHGAPSGIFFYDSNLIIREVNQEFMNILEVPKDYIVGLDLKNIPDQRVLPSLRAPFDDIQGFYEGQYRTQYISKDLWIMMNTSPLKDSKQQIIGAIGILSDITQRMQIQLDIEHQAKYDLLTDIPNRSTLMQRIQQEIIRYKRHKIIFGVLFLDLDHFKNINDSLGHDIGDKLLVETALRFKGVIRDEDTVARIGGDEFVILLPDLSQAQQHAASKAEATAQKIHAVLEASFDIKGHHLRVSTSIGIALINNNESSDDLIKHADIAMYQAKKDGRGVSRFYQEDMDKWIRRRLTIENGLRLAIQKSELEIHYQPIVEFSTNNLVGAEALLRWNTPDFESVFPDEFIPVAEESGLILSIGEWVLNNAVEQFAAWKKQFPQKNTLKKIAVNVSVHQFNNSNFLMQVNQAIQKNEIEPHSLELELTESIIVSDVNIVRAKMQELRDLGVGISIDDFGTGYSSLSYLKKLPFTTLKIDKSFVQDIQYDADDKELISTILTIADNFDLEVLAEGIENYEQYTFLNDKGCQYFQGYYYAKPMSAENFTKLLESCSCT